AVGGGRWRAEEPGAVHAAGRRAWPHAAARFVTHRLGALDPGRGEEPGSLHPPSFRGRSSLRLSPLLRVCGSPAPELRPPLAAPLGAAARRAVASPDGVRVLSAGSAGSAQER